MNETITADHFESEATRFEREHGNAKALVDPTFARGILGEGARLTDAEGNDMLGVAAPQVQASANLLEDAPQRTELPLLVGSSEQGFVPVNIGDVDDETPEAPLSEEDEAAFLKLLEADIAEKGVEGSTMLASMTSQTQKMQSLFKDLKKFQKEYPIVMGRIVHVKKRSSKTRKKKRR